MLQFETTRNGPCICRFIFNEICPLPSTALHRCSLSLIMRFFPRGKLLFPPLSLSPFSGTSTRVPSPSPSCSSTTTSWTTRTSDENRPRFWRGVVAQVVRPWSPAVVRHCPARGSEQGPVGTPGDAPGCRWMTMPSG